MPKMPDVDIAIIGAGPAGAAAAIQCKKNNLSVALIDKAEFPRDKVCGDGIPLKTFTLLQELGFKESDLFTRGYKISRLKVYSPAYRITEYGSLKPDASTKSGCIPRAAFDAMLFERAAQAADKTYTGYKLTAIDRSGGQAVLTLQNNTSGDALHVTARGVIGADGANSMLARLLGMLKRDPAHHFDGLRCYFKGKKFDSAVHLFYDKRSLPGYVWVFPVAEDRANVGIMIDKACKKKNDKNIRDLFFEIIQTNPNIKEILAGAEAEDKPYGAPLPLGTLPGNRISDNTILIGDAAAFINPVTGGGIYFAIQSAIKAADVFAGAIQKNNLSQDALQIYEKWWRAAFLPGFEYSDMLRRWFKSEKFTTWFLNMASRFKPFANFFIMVYGRPLPRKALWHPLFWAKILLKR